MNFLSYLQNNKYILIVVISGLVAGLGAWVFVSFFTPSDNETNISNECKQIEQELDTLIQKAAYCEIDSDCVAADRVPGKPPCGCMYAINKVFDPSKLKNNVALWYVNACMNPTVVCSPCGPPSLTTKCRESRCVGIYEQREQINSSWQAYQNEGFGFEMRYPKNYPIPEEYNDIFSSFLYLRYYNENNLSEIDNFPVISSIQLISKESIRRYIDESSTNNIRTKRSTLLDIFSRQKEALNNSNDYEESTFTRISDSSYLVSPRVCGGNIYGCALIKYTTFMDDVQIDISVGFDIGTTGAAMDSLISHLQIKNTLRPADGELPVAGACGGPVSGNIAAIILNQDTPIPRCIKVSANQQLQITNNTNEVVDVALGPVAMQIEPGKTQTDSRTFGSYLALGVHFVQTSLYGGGGPEIWMQ